MLGRFSSRTLLRWLETGRPRRVSRRLGTDPALAERLEALTALRSGEAEALDQLLTPTDDFGDRVLAGVQERREVQGTGLVVFDLVGLGFHVGRALLEPPSQRREDDATEGSEVQ